MNHTRIVTGVLLVLGCSAIILWSPVWLGMLIWLGLLVLAWREWSDLLQMKRPWLPWLGWLGCALGWYGLLSFYSFTQVHLYLYPAMCLLWGSIAWAVKQYPRPSLAWAYPWLPYVWVVSTLLSTWYYLGYLYLYGYRGWLLCYCLLIVCSDSMAYWMGRRYGRRTWLAVSPKKTWVGVFFGVVSPVLLGLLGMLAIQASWEQIWIGGVMLVGVALGGIVGDLFVSLLKRQAGAKDSGTLLPGHGGILDRIDSIMGGAPHYAAMLYGLGIVV